MYTFQSSTNNPKKPNRLSYPTFLIEHRIAVLQRDLRLIQNWTTREKISKSQAQMLGENVIKNTYNLLETDIKNYLEKRKVKYEGKKTELEKDLHETLVLWREIINDLQP